MSTAPVRSSRPHALAGLVRLTSLNVFILFLLISVIFTLLSPSHRLIDPDNITVYLGLGAEFMRAIFWENGRRVLERVGNAANEHEVRT